MFLGEGARRDRDDRHQRDELFLIALTEPSRSLKCASMRSPIYAHPLIYRFVLKALYGRALEERFRAVSALVPHGASLLDVCAGDGAIRDSLHSSVRYTAVDGNETFVSGLKKKGVPAELRDVRYQPLPEADVVLMMGSLYHFVPDTEAMIEKLKKAAKRRLIIVEPHVNWSSKAGVIGWLSQRLSDPGISGSHLGRLGGDALDALAEKTTATHVSKLEREYVLVWDHT
jgi:hypothetical protein